MGYSGAGDRQLRQSAGAPPPFVRYCADSPPGGLETRKTGPSAGVCTLLPACPLATTRTQAASLPCSTKIKYSMTGVAMRTPHPLARGAPSGPGGEGGAKQRKNGHARAAGTGLPGPGCAGPSLKPLYTGRMCCSAHPATLRRCLAKASTCQLGSQGSLRTCRAPGSRFARPGTTRTEHSTSHRPSG